MAVHLVTGGAGFIGSHLAQRLLEEGHEVAVIDNLSGGWLDNVPKEAKFANLDLVTTDIDLLFRSLKPDNVWHLAAYAAEGLSHWVREHNVKNNWLASTRLINGALKYGVERFTFTSSMAVYGSQEPPFTEYMRPMPEDPYGIAKFSVEQDLKAAGEVLGLPYVIFRPHNVYGPNQNIGDPYRNVVGIFMRKAMQGEPIGIFGDGEQTRAFSYVSDIIDPMVRSLDEQVDGQCFNVGGEEIITINDLAERVIGMFPRSESNIEHWAPRYEVKHAFCDHAKARNVLGFKPEVDFDDGLGVMAGWAERAGIRWSKTPGIELKDSLPSFWQEVSMGEWK